MRLRAIAGMHPLQLHEAISKQDFFDFYALATAHQEPHLRHGDPDHDRDVQRLLGFQARHVFQDQMLQLAQIIAERLMDPDEESDDYLSPGMAEIIRSFGLQCVPDHDQMVAHLRREELAGLTLSQRARLLVQLRKYRQEHGGLQGFTGADGMWAGLVDKYVELARTPDSLGPIIRAVDRIYGLCHHGGMITDYMDEEPWLEQALHIRQAAPDAGSLLPYTSTEVRDLVQSAAYGSAPPSVTPIQQLAVAMNKAMGTNGNCKLRGDTLELQSTLYLVPWLAPNTMRLVHQPQGEAQQELQVAAEVTYAGPTKLHFLGACGGMQHQAEIPLRRSQEHRPLQQAHEVLQRMQETGYKVVRQERPDITIM